MTHSGRRHITGLCALAAMLFAQQAHSVLSNGAGWGGEPAKVAEISLSSVSRAMENLSGVLEASGVADSAGMASAIISWLTMVPSIDCADLSRPATIVFLTTPDPHDLPDQVAVIPLSPIGGEYRLRDSLAAAYAKVDGRTVLSCTGPLNAAVTESLHVIVAKSVAYVANSREALRWIARRHMEGNIPSPDRIRDDDAATVMLHSELAIPVIENLLGAGERGEQTLSIGILERLRDLLRGLRSFTVSFAADQFAADLNSFVAAFKLEPLSPLEDATDAAKSIESLLPSIPLEAYSISAGAIGGLSTLLPASITSPFRGATAYSYIATFNLLPGFSESDTSALRPFLTGQRLSAFLVSHAIPWPAKIEVLGISDPVGAEKALERIFSGTPPATISAFSPIRTSGGRKVFGYTAMRKHGSKDDEDYAASSIVLLAELNKVELAVIGDRLVVISGHPGQIDLWLEGNGFHVKERDFASLASTLGDQVSGAVAIGAGQLQISKTLRTFFGTRDALRPLLERIPRFGNGIEWRISRTGGALLCEAHVSSSELRAISSISKIDNNFINNILMNLIIDETEL